MVGQRVEPFRGGVPAPLETNARAHDLPPWAEKLTRLLDDLIRIPGTGVGFGLDSLIGLVLPGAGDALTGVGSVALLFLALKRGVPSVVIARMVMNIGIDALVGTIPVVGDLFDVAWKANRKNLELLKLHDADPTRKPSTADYALVGVGLLLVVMAILLPILFVTLVAGQLMAWLRGA
jgi:hypothetical protein